MDSTQITVPLEELYKLQLQAELFNSQVDHVTAMQGNLIAIVIGMLGIMTLLLITAITSNWLKVRSQEAKIRDHYCPI